MKKRVYKLIALALAGVMTLSLPQIPAGAAGNSDIIYMEKEKIQINNIGEERSTLFNDGWKFFLGESSNAQEVSFNDSSWRTVDLPHDYSIEQEFTTKGEAESGFLLGGTGWYRKSFTLSEDLADKDITIDFDGVYMNASVYVNGVKVGNHPYGYTGFSFDISDYVVCDGATQNVIAVKVEHKTPSSRFYSGSGIYRDVYLGVTDKVHVGRYGTTVTTPSLETQKDGNVDVHVTTSVENDGNQDAAISIINTVYDSAGQAVSESVTSQISVPAGETLEVPQSAKVGTPVLWSCENPALYYVKTEIVKEGQAADTYETEFGFRYMKYDANKGFFLNGENVKLKGVCMHHDQGSLGAKAYEDAVERQILILKEMGCNAIRVTHNPASSVMVELANRYGMMLIDEAFDTWLYAKNGNSNDYSVYFNKNITDDNQIIGGDSSMTWSEMDMKEMVSRGKNAPSIIMWSIGNEVQEGIGGNTSNYPQITRQLIQWGKEVDDTRPYTIGDNKIKANNSIAIQSGDVITELGGVVGLNYCDESIYKSRHSQSSNWLMVGSETASSISSRGIYYTKDKDNSGLQMTAYDKQAVGWGALASKAWFDVVRNDFVSGEFVWTGFDYIGEPTPWNGTGSGSVSGQGAIPKSSYFGIIDTAGLPKDNYYLYQSMWNDTVHTLHVLPCWDRENIVISNGNAEVSIYSDAAKVELYLNNKLVGTAESQVKTTAEGHSYRLWQGGTAHNNQYITFQVPYEEGTLTAKAYDENGNEITDTAGRSSVTTSGAPAKLQLNAVQSYQDYTSVDADGRSLSYIEIDVTDANGVPDPDAANNITLTVEGEGELVGTDNGNPTDTTCYVPQSISSTTRKAFSGKAVAIVKSTKKAGGFTLTASADGLETSSIHVDTAAAGADQDSGITAYEMSRHGYVSVGCDNVLLPETAKVYFGDGTEGEKSIQWESYDHEKLNEVGSFVVKGLIQQDGVSIKVSFTVHVAGKIAGGVNYSSITQEGVIPNLPDTIQTILDTGNVYEEFPVTWEEIKAEDFSAVGTIVQVDGSVAALGQEYPVKAFIRVAEPVYGNKNNIAPAYLDLSESCTKTTDNLLSITNGILNAGETEQNERWSNWNERNLASTPYITFTWATIHLIDQINLYFYKENVATSQLPTSVKFEYTMDGSNWLPVDYEPVTEVAAPAVTEYKLTQLINPIGIRIHMGHDIGSFIGLTEAEIISTDVSYTANTSAVLSELKVDNNVIEGFQSDKFEYSVMGNRISSITASDNAAVTVLPEKDGFTRILVVSEDQKTRNLYTIELKNEGNNYPSAISLNAPGTEVQEGDRVQLTAAVTDRDGHDITAQSAVTYEIVGGPGTVSQSGELTFAGPGSVEVRARAVYNNREVISDSVTFTVRSKPVVKVLDKTALKASKTSVTKSEKVQLYTNAWNQFGEDITGSCSISYQITGPASADSKGVLSFKGTGKVTVYASVSYGGVTKNSPAVTINVKDDPKTKLKKPVVKSVASTLAKSGSKVKITVSRTVKGADTYTVYRKVGSKTVKIGKADKKGIIYDLKPLTDGRKAYYYAIASSKNSKYTSSDKSTSKSITLPKAPAKVKAVKKGNTIKITWSSRSKVKEYIIFRSLKSTTGFSKIASVKKLTSYTDKKAKKGKKYYYAVLVKNTSGKYSGMKVSARVKF